MRTLKCKNCGGEIEWKYGTGQKEFVNGTVTYTIGCPNCRQNIVYEMREVIQYSVDKITTNDDVEDTVNHPSHYTKYEREVIDSIRGLCTADEYRGYLKGNQIKYLARYQDKNGLEDLRKHRWYVDALIEFEERSE